VTCNSNALLSHAQVGLLLACSCLHHTITQLRLLSYTFTPHGSYIRASATSLRTSLLALYLISLCIKVRSCVTLGLASPLIETTSQMCMDFYTFTGPRSATPPGRAIHKFQLQLQLQLQLQAAPKHKNNLLLNIVHCTFWAGWEYNLFFQFLGERDNICVNSSCQVISIIMRHCEKPKSC
jgi:hypothetical protein